MIGMTPVGEARAKVAAPSGSTHATQLVTAMTLH